MKVILPVPGSAPGLVLRPWRLEDLSALVAAHRDPVLRRWLSTSLTDEARARQWLGVQAAGWAAGTRFSFAVVPEAADQSVLGHVAVTVATGDVAEVGYWTAAHARGRGLAVGALDTVSRWALRTQDTVLLTRLALFHTDGNRASCRVAVKRGYPLQDLLPAAPPAFPSRGHRHARTAAGDELR